MNTEALKSKNLLDTTHTAAAALFAQTEYPWEVLPLIKGFVSALGKTLDANEYTEIAPEVWVHKSVKIAPTASLNGPCIIGEGTEVRQCAFVRGSALIGAHCVIGNSTEVKNSIMQMSLIVPSKETSTPRHEYAKSVSSEIRSPPETGAGMQNLFNNGIALVKNMPRRRAATPTPAVWYMSRDIK